jgi:uncharacterized protein with HEPN domain
MSKRVDDVYLLEMRMYAQRALERIADATKQEFLANDALLESVAFNLLQIGEAARKLSAEFRATQDSVPWDEIIGRRHRIVHGYSNTDRAKLWETVTSDLRPLLASIEQLLSR